MQEWILSLEVLNRHALVSIITNQESRQVGLIAATANGTIKYWENILYGQDSFKLNQLALGAHDMCLELCACEVVHLINCYTLNSSPIVQPAGFMLGTSSSYFYHLVPTTNSGISQLSVTPLSKPSFSLFNHVTSLFGYQASLDNLKEPQSIIAGPLIRDRFSR